ncbi:polynucleotide kinase [Vibrio phage EniLVp02]
MNQQFTLVEPHKTARILYLTVGAPASGKTSHAKTMAAGFAVSGTPFININRDDIRREIHGLTDWSTYVFSKENEGKVTERAKELFLDFWRAHPHGNAVCVISDTNLNPQLRQVWYSMASEQPDVEVRHIIFPVDTNTLIKRDAAREMTVGAKVIQSMNNKLFKDPDNIKLVQDVMRQVWQNMLKQYPPKSYHPYFDIDGTLAEKGSRSAFDESRVSEDTPRLNVCDLHDMYHRAPFAGSPMYNTGRTDSCREDTTNWLNKHLTTLVVPYAAADNRLLMRRTGDSRPDWYVKFVMLCHRLFRFGQAPLVCIDDRQQVVDMYRALGVEVWQVAEGNF